MTRRSWARGRRRAAALGVVVALVPLGGCAGTEDGCPRATIPFPEDLRTAIAALDAASRAVGIESEPREQETVHSQSGSEMFSSGGADLVSVEVRRSVTDTFVVIADARAALEEQGFETTSDEYPGGGYTLERGSQRAVAAFGYDDHGTNRVLLEVTTGCRPA